MACATCASPHRQEAERQLRNGTPQELVAAWLTARGTKIGRLAVGRHQRAHMKITRAPGRKPPSTDFLTDLRDEAHIMLAEGELKPTLSLGVKAAQAIEDRTARGEDRVLSYQLAQLLGGAYQPALPDGTVIDVTPDEWAEEAAEDRAMFARLADGDLATLTEGDDPTGIVARLAATPRARYVARHR